MSTYGDSAKTKTITKRKYARIVALLRATTDKDNHQTNASNTNGGTGSGTGTGSAGSGEVGYVATHCCIRNLIVTLRARWKNGTGHTSVYFGGI